MRRRQFVPHILLAIAMALAVAATACADEERPPITVFAAASLADALQPLGDTFAAEHGVEVRFSFGGSTTLAQQLVRGAPADLFISAGELPMDHVESARLLASGSRVDLLGNALALVGPVDGAATIVTPEDLLGDDVRRIAMADPALAPAGVYTQEALETLGLWDSIQPKLIYGPDVRTALQYAATAAVDAAIVYASDASNAEGVRDLWRFPAGSHVPVTYPAAVLAESGNRDGAATFLAFLGIEESLAVFRAHGFTTPRSPAP
ncbi:MAG: molybdate ABC transporter substrate-binding protein [Chloroflexi bacterium]|nr:molybdate ABC transporter substrate-binding protein [Chloroflexota bacterium]